MPSFSSVEMIAPAGAAVESTSSAVSWGPIIAGALTAGATTLILVLLGSGLGLSVMSPWSTGVSATTFAVSAAAWLIIVQWLSAGLGGYLTGRLRTRWVDVHDDEVYFRDTAHGFLAWALATLMLVALVGSTATSVVGSGVQAASRVVSGAVLGAGAGPADRFRARSQTGGASGYFVDSLFRPANPAAAASAQGPEGAAAATGEATRILVESAATGGVSSEDRAYLAQLVTARTGLSQGDAEARVNTVLKRIDEARNKAKDAARAARKAGLTAALVGALSLFIGAFIAAVAAAIGGHERDQREAQLGTR